MGIVGNTHLYRLVFLFALLTVMPFQVAFALPGLSDRPLNGSCTAPDRLATQGEIELQPILASLGDVTWPVDMVQPPNDPTRWYVVDREGVVYIYQAGDPFTRTGTFIDIRSKVQREYNGRAWNEMGLLGMVFHPDFANNGEFFLYYSTDGTNPDGGKPVAARLSRFKTVNGGVTALSQTEEIIFSIDRNKQFHWAGRPTFGSDGYLYITLGDASTPVNGQNLNTNFGKMLRIDVDSGNPYGIPSDNPFVGKNGNDEIYAYGFRNPWRWSFDSLTGEIWLGDVGNSKWEEVNKVIKGKNYGWRNMEGPECSQFDPDCNINKYELPVTAYQHNSNAGPIGNAVIGGYVYRGASMPSLYGKYIYADVGGTIWAYDETTDQNDLLLDSGNFTLSISESIDDRELYLLVNRQIYRLTETNVAGTTNGFPDLLSETGCFNSADPKIPGNMLIPYDVNTPLWSDNAQKDRWMLVPDGKDITIESDGDWTYPIGSILFKNFALNNVLVETRLLVKHDDGDWAGYSYEWNNGLTDAVLVPQGGKEKVVGSQTWSYPSRSQCVGCHTVAAGRSLGLETAQLNKDIEYPSTGITANQLETLEHIGLFSASLPDIPANLDALPSITDASASLESRARAYLHSNCAMCHRPNGIGQGPEDFRYYLPLSQIGALNVAPTQGNLGIQDGKLIYPGVPEKSIMALRLHTLGSKRMPPLGTSIVDATAAQLIDDWIRTITIPDVECGEPLVNAQVDKGLFVWQDCTTLLWNLLSSAGGDPDLVFTDGSILTDSIFSDVVPVSQETSDIYGLDSTKTVIDYSFNVKNSGIDGGTFSVPVSAGVCIYAMGNDTGDSILVGPNKTPVSTPYDLQGAICDNQPATSDTVTIFKAKYYPSDKKVWVRASTDHLPAGNAVLTVTAKINGIDQALGQLNWRSSDNVYQKSFKNITMEPECITVNSSLGAVVQVPIEGTVGNCNPVSVSSELSIANLTINEAEGTASVVVTLSPTSSDTVTVEYTTVDGVAVDGNDYTATSGTLTFNAGVATQVIPISITDDTLTEANEAFTVLLSSPINAVIADNEAIVTIMDNDSTTISSISVSDREIIENAGTVLVEVSLDSASQDVITVDYATKQGTASGGGTDYKWRGGTLTFNPGDMTKSIIITIVDDTLDENDETFTLKLSSPTQAVLADNSATITILDNDDGGNVDTVTIEKAIYYSSDDDLWVKATTDALPAGVAVLTVKTVLNGVETTVGTLPWKAGKGFYQKNFHNITKVPDAVIVTSDQGGGSTSSIEVR